MHTIEPFYNWRDFYIASEDSESPFYGRVYNEFGFDHQIYNYLIHPQWDTIESSTLYIKILFVDYFEGAAIIELIGEWNDIIDNDIMLLKRNVIDKMLSQSITRFVLIGENILNFHGDIDDYYEEWYETIADEGGWISTLHFRPHVVDEMQKSKLKYYFNFNEAFNIVDWRTMRPHHLIKTIDQLVERQIANI